MRHLSLSVMFACALLLATGTAFAQERVTAVELHLPPGTDPSGLSEQIAVRQGQPLSRREVRRSIERLHATGRFADVVVRSVPANGGVRVVFEITPKQKLASLDILGERVLTTAEIAAAAQLDAGDEYYPELVDRAVERVASVYRRKGYRQALIEVELREGESGLDVLLTIEEGEPTWVKGVSLGGNPGLPVARVVDALGIGVGQVLDTEQLERGIEQLKALYRKERFYRARVGDPEILDDGKGAIVAIPVTAGPRYEFHFRGNRSFPDKLLRAILNYDGSETLDEGVMARMSRRVATFYRYRGFHEVRVFPRELRSPDHARGIIGFDIEEGPPLYVEKIQFEGNEVLPDATLKRILAEQIRAMEPVPLTEIPQQADPLELEGRARGNARYPSPHPDPERVWVPEAWEEAARAMREAYRERGHMRATVVLKSAQIDVDRHTATVTFDLFEGPESRVVELKYKGLPVGFDPSRAAQVRTGQPFRTGAVDDTARSLERALGREGYLFARVEGESSLSADGRDARVFFRVDPGPRVRVDQVIVRGAKRTDEDVIRANLVVKEGSVLDPEALFESQRNLVLLGIFRNVAVKLISPEVVESTKDVVVEVRERPRIAGEIGGGYSLVDGPRLVGDLLYPNISGTGMSLSGRMKVNYMGASAQVISNEKFDPEEVSGFDGVDFRGNVAISHPRIYALLPAKVGARLDLIGERAHHPSGSYTFQRLAAVAGLDWAALQWLNMSLQYEIERDNVRLSTQLEELTRTDLERLRFPSGDFPMHSVRPTVTLDFRDDFARPSKGLLISGSAELTRDFGATLIDETPLSIHTLKVSGNITGYVPLAHRTVLALSARGGKIFHLDEASQTIAPKRFFLGGSTSLRGFSEESVIAEDRRADLRDDVTGCRTLAHGYGCTPDAKVLRAGRQLPSEGGELFTLLKSELRFPAYGAFDLGVFFEAGNLWMDAELFELLRLRYVTGAGIRYGTPIGPLALDVGFNLFPDVELNEPTWNLHFSIGLF